MAISNLKDAFSFQRKMMILAGIWPKRNPTWSYILLGLVTYLTMVAFCGSLFLSCIYVKEFSDLIQSWAMFVSILNCCLKFGTFYFKIPVFLELMDFLNNPHFTYYDHDLDEHLARGIKIANIMVKLFLASALSTIASLSAAPMANPKPRQLPLPFAFDLTNETLPYYLSIYTLQSAGLFAAGWTSTGFDNVAISMMGIASAYFKILRTTIIRTTDPKNFIDDNRNSAQNIIEIYGQFDNTINSKLYRCVEHHLAVIRFAEYIESIFTYVILMQFIASGAGICLAGFTFATAPVGSTEFLFALSLPITLMLQISLYCIFGNEVTIHSSRIGDACYMTEWIGCGPLVRKTLFIIMERSKRPLVLTAGKFINLSLASLVSVFRSAVSYGAVLRQLYQQ